MPACRREKVINNRDFVMMYCHARCSGCLVVVVRLQLPPWRGAAPTTTASKQTITNWCFQHHHFQPLRILFSHVLVVLISCTVYRLIAVLLCALPADKGKAFTSSYCSCRCMVVVRRRGRCISTAAVTLRGVVREFVYGLLEGLRPYDIQELRTPTQVRNLPRALCN